MYLDSISLLDYKNIEQAEISCCSKLNCFLGDNGAGKTNLLDAIYYLSFSKSFFNSIDSQNVRHGQEMFLIKGKYNRLEEEETISVGFKQGQKKQFKRNKKAYKKLADHIGLFPLVMVSPSDTSLILGGSDERRKFMDGVISQFDRNYLEALLRYNRALQQRNNLLKHFAEQRNFDVDTLSIYDEQLIEYGNEIFEKRTRFIEEMIPVFQHFYAFVSQGKEQVVLGYDSALKDQSLRDLLEHSRNKDRMIQYTSVGIHKDDLTLGLGDYAIKKLGSQGQTKTFLVALKFAQFEYLKKQGGIKPILLLDDIFDKLDAGRVGKIIELVSDDNFGQIFVTDTNREHLDGILEQMDTIFKIYRVEKGKVTPQ